MWNLVFLFTGLIFILMLVVIFKSKEREMKTENKIFYVLSLINIIGFVIEISLQFSIINFGIYKSTSVFLGKLYIAFLFVWFTIFSIYNFLISLLNSKNYKIIKYIHYFIGFIGVMLIFILPIEFYYNNGEMYSYGKTVDLLKVFLGLYIFAWLFILIKNYKHIFEKKYYPIFIAIILLVGNIILQSLNPTILIATFMITFVCYLIFFTIENPDIKMVDELIKNRKIIERTNEEKSLFFFKMSQDMKYSIDYIDKEIDNYKNSNLNKKEIDEIIYNISLNNSKIKYLINNAFNINKDDKNNIKILKNTYNIYSLLNEIEKRTRKDIKDGVDLKFIYSDNIPNELYGDSLKLKQVLISVLENAIKNTSKGYIHVDVSTITKYDTCRIIFSVKDSGCGIELDVINTILNQDTELTDKEYEKLNSLDVDLVLTNKIIKMLNGTLYIRSKVNEGTEVLITLDQYIKEDDDKEKLTTINHYIKTRTNNKRVLVVNDDEQELRTIRNQLEQMGYDVSTSLHGNDCIDRLKNKEAYDIILIDDKMNVISGFDLIKELIKLKNSSKKMVLLEKDKLFISHHYLEEGFDNYIDKSNFANEFINKL